MFVNFVCGGAYQTKHTFLKSCKLIMKQEGTIWKQDFVDLSSAVTGSSWVRSFIFFFVYISVHAGLYTGSTSCNIWHHLSYFTV